MAFLFYAPLDKTPQEAYENPALWPELTNSPVLAMKPQRQVPTTLERPVAQVLASQPVHPALTSLLGPARHAKYHPVGNNLHFNSPLRSFVEPHHCTPQGHLTGVNPTETQNSGSFTWELVKGRILDSIPGLPNQNLQLNKIPRELEWPLKFEKNRGTNILWAIQDSPARPFLMT